MFKQATKKQLIISVTLLVVLIGVNVSLRLFSSAHNYDIVVLGEVDAIRQGVERFKALNQQYPISLSEVPLNSPVIGTEKLCDDDFHDLGFPCNRVLMSRIPNFFASDKYYYKSAGNQFLLHFVLENNHKKLNLVKGANCLTNEGFKPQPCF